MKNLSTNGSSSPVTGADCSTTGITAPSHQSTDTIETLAVISDQWTLTKTSNRWVANCSVDVQPGLPDKVFNEEEEEEVNCKKAHWQGLLLKRAEPGESVTCLKMEWDNQKSQDHITQTIRCVTAAMRENPGLPVELRSRGGITTYIRMALEPRVEFKYEGQWRKDGDSFSLHREAAEGRVSPKILSSTPSRTTWR